jgi:rhamnose utilization protein RhaD (predicted bifunctional aldolase and dehydrogenase)
VYTKRVPMITRDVQAYAAAYRAYLDTFLGVEASSRIDAAPRIFLDPQLGLCAFGTTDHEAELAADMYRHDIAIISRASLHGRYRSAPPSAIAQAEFEYGGYASTG